jgi:hypothetical protein
MSAPDSRRAGAAHRLGRQPGVEHRQRALLSNLGLEHATIEQHGGVGVQELLQPRRAVPAKALQLGGGARLAAQQGGQMARDTGVLRVGQAQLGQPAAGAG